MVGLGTLGSKEGSGQLRIVAKQQKMKISAKNAKRMAKQGGGWGGTSTASGLQTTGLQTSLAFTPVQGFELADPTKLPGGQQAPQLQQRSGTESYFSALSGFRSTKKLG